MNKLNEIIFQNLTTYQPPKWLLDCIKNIAINYADYCCENQKQICFDNLKYDNTFNSFINSYVIDIINKDSILKCKTFNENEKNNIR